MDLFKEYGYTKAEVMSIVENPEEYTPEDVENVADILKNVNIENYSK